MSLVAPQPQPITARPQGFLRQLLRDTGGNVMIITAAALFPLLALIGSGIDMGRGYLAQSRLQQACDAGTLAARKRLGTMAAVNGQIPDTVADTGQRFFNINFRTNAYGSENRQFVMELEDDYAISGTATAEVPTTVMGAFGFGNIAVDATCSAQVNMPNTDIMMVLDTTGSMLQTNSGDSESRIDALRTTVKSFHAQMEANKPAGTRIRYGFVPYSTNVNVGHLLRDEWLVDEWEYNFRESRASGRTEEQTRTESRYTYISGTIVDSALSYGPTCPANTVTHTVQSDTTDAEGWRVQQILEQGIAYSCREVDVGVFEVQGRTFNDHLFQYATRPTATETVNVAEWRYNTIRFDLGFLATSNHTTVPMGGSAANPSNVDVWYRGCVEERDTYEITDYDNVDLRRAIDLDIDRVPNANIPASQWRPMINELSYTREVRSNGRGGFTPGPVNSDDEFVNAWWWGFGACPTPAHQLSEMTADDVATYVDGLDVQGNTYHDIGMIWGGRLLSPTGLFAAQNADLGSNATSRHLIFLTDGQTAPLDLSYGAYGIEPLDRRRWRPTSSMSLTETVENRFSFACEEVKRRNIQVWVISFGTASNPMMENCAGVERYFVADDAAELEQTFSTIARRMGELRIVD